MTILYEGQLRFDFSAAISAKRFDDQLSHGIDSMKKVDFIVEEQKRLLFIEVKDPDNRTSNKKNLEIFKEKFDRNELERQLIYKYRDSYIYELMCRNVKKPVYYYILLEWSRLDPTQYVTFTDRIKKKLPIQGPSTNIWLDVFVTSCVVMNITTWNHHLPYAVSRIP